MGQRAAEGDALTSGLYFFFAQPTIVSFGLRTTRLPFWPIIVCVAVCAFDAALHSPLVTVTGELAAGSDSVNLDSGTSGIWSKVVVSFVPVILTLPIRSIVTSPRSCTTMSGSERAGFLTKYASPFSGALSSDVTALPVPIFAAAPQLPASYSACLQALLTTERRALSDLGRSRRTLAAAAWPTGCVSVATSEVALRGRPGPCRRP